MLDFIKDIIRKKKIGIDLFSHPIKTTELKDELFSDKALEDIAFEIGGKEFKKEILNTKYWCDYQIMEKLISYVLKKHGKQLFKPTLIVSVPSDISNSEWKNIWFKMLVDATKASSIDKVYFVENFIVAAIGAGVPVDKAEKNLFVYTTRRCSYVGIIFKRRIFNLEVINKAITEITEEDIKDKINKINNENALEVPNDFYFEPNLSERDINQIKLDFSKDINKEVYLAVPGRIQDSLGLFMDDKRLIYADNYEFCNIKGLNKTINELKSSDFK